MVEANFGAIRHGVAWGLAFSIVVLFVAYRASESMADGTRAAIPGIVSYMFRANAYGQRFAIQWFAFPTYAAGAVLSVAVVAAWSVIRSAGGWRELPRFLLNGPAAKWAGPLADVSRSAVGLGGFLLLMYLLAAPDAVRVAEREFQQRILPVRDPAAYWVEFTEAAALSESQVSAGQSAGAQ